MFSASKDIEYIHNCAVEYGIYLQVRLDFVIFTSENLKKLRRRSKINVLSQTVFYG